MSAGRIVKTVLKIAAFPILLYLVLLTVVYFGQRSLIFMPSHTGPSSTLSPWMEGDRVIGWCREVPNPRSVWLMMHGNAGQAAHRDYVLNCMSDQDSLYVLEYPGYGARAGQPSRESMNAAASEAYRLLRSRDNGTSVCVLAESIGSGPACALAGEKTPPDKIVLIVPFDSLANVAARHYWYFPVRLLLHDRWDNVEALRHYTGPVEVFAATDDVIIPIEHARALARQVPGAHLREISGGHNDWAESGKVEIKPPLR